MIFIDRSIPKPVAQALQCVRDDVEWLEPLFAPATKDTEWLPVAGANDWLVIVRDKKVRTRPGEKKAIVDNRVGCFILNQGSDPTKWEYLRLLAKTLDEMLAKYSTTPKPFIYTVDREGNMKLIDLG